MNNISEQALVGELQKLKTAHNTLVNKVIADLDKHAQASDMHTKAIKQIVEGVTALETRMNAIETFLRAAMATRTGQPVAVPGRVPPARQAQPQSANLPAPSHAAPLRVAPSEIKPNGAPPPGSAPPSLSSGWSDDEEDAEYTDE